MSALLAIKPRFSVHFSRQFVMNFLFCALLPYSDSKSSPDAASREFGEQTQENTHGATRKQFLIATPTHGFFIYDGASFQPFQTEADAFLLQNSIEDGAAFADGSYALGTRYGGLAII